NPDRPIWEDDSVQIHATLSAPAYAYVIALHPNGQIQLYYPASDRIPPPLASRIDCPTQPDDHNRQVNKPLTDGIGLQAFVMVASADPLPPSGDGINEHRVRPPWHPTSADAESVWRFDGVPVGSVTRQDMPTGLRSENRQFRMTPPPTFVES